MLHALILAPVLTCASCHHDDHHANVDIRVSTDGRDARLEGRWTRDIGYGVSTEARGRVDTRGNWDASLVVSGNCLSVRASTDGHNGRLDAGFTRDLGGGLSVGVKGHVDTRGNWGASIGASLKFRRKRRNTEQMRYYTLSLNVNQCNFNLYDVNRDDVITQEELVAVFGDSTNTTELFEALDMLSGDGMVDREEFLHVMSRTVEGC